MTELFAAGFILGISYTFTKNLWLPTFFHFGWNLFQGLFGFEIPENVIEDIPETKSPISLSSLVKILELYQCNSCFSRNYTYPYDMKSLK